MKNSNRPEMIEINTPDGKKMIPRTRAVFRLRDAETKDGKKVLLATDAAYTRDAQTGCLLRLGKRKPDKAAKKAAKREKVKALSCGFDPRLYKLAEQKGWPVPSTQNVFSPETWNNYWSQMEAHEKGQLEGRPVAPHRSGAPHATRTI